MNNNELIFDLEKALEFKNHIDNRNVSTPNRARIMILQNKLFAGTQSVIFWFKITNKTSFMKYCCPLTREEYKLLAGSNYIPILRSGKYLKVGLASFMENFYAYSDIQFPLDSHAIDFMTAFEYLQRELELYLEVLDEDALSV